METRDFEELISCLILQAHCLMLQVQNYHSSSSQACTEKGELT